VPERDRRRLWTRQKMILRRQIHHGESGKR
jgi:hypothetical protein